jgi:2-hydroxychromene-2-carboxylate isomerase
MPKAVRSGTLPTRMIAWTILFAMAAAYLYNLWYHPLIVGTITAVGVAVVARNKRRMRRHLKELAEARKGDSICEFSRAFDVRSTDAWVIRAVYEQLQQQLRWVYPEFPVRATDRLIEDLMLDPDDIDMDVFVDVTKRTGRSRRNTKENPLYGQVNTAGDLVAFFCAQEKP